jgi:hypothetical protein
MLNQTLNTMTKGHNQGKIQAEKEENSKGQSKKLKDSTKDKSPGQGRNTKDMAEGKKGKNNV